MSIRVHGDEDLLKMLIRGMKLLELTGLGGSGSRGYGKIRFKLDDAALQARVDGAARKSVPQEILAEFR